MNLTQIIQRARELSGIRSTALKSDAAFATLVDEAYLELAGVANWPFLYTHHLRPVNNWRAAIAWDRRFPVEFFRLIR
jgi:hypothetical protein